VVMVCTDRTFIKPRLVNGKYRYDIGIPKQGFSIDGWLKNNIDNYLIPAVKRHWDGVCLFTGLEGSGKTTIATTVAAYIDPTFNLKRVVFTQEQLMKAIDTLPPQSAVVFDEAVMAALAQDAATAAQTVLIKKFTTCRKKQLYIFLVIPSIFMLRKYFAILRTRALIHTYSPDSITRGCFKFYGWETKRKLYIQGYRDFDMGVVRPDFIGSFRNTMGYFFHPDHYDEKKERLIQQIDKQQADATSFKPSKAMLRLKEERSAAMYVAYFALKFHHERKHAGEQKSHAKFNPQKFCDLLQSKYGWKVKTSTVRSCEKDAMEYFQKCKLEEDFKKQMGGEANYRPSTE